VTGRKSLSGTGTKTPLKSTAKPKDTKPKPVTDNHKFVVSSAASWRHSIVLTGSGDLYGWGVVNSLVPYTRALDLDQMNISSSATVDIAHDSGLATHHSVSLLEPFEILIRPTKLQNLNILELGGNKTASQTYDSSILVKLTGSSQSTLSFVTVDLEQHPQLFRSNAVHALDSVAPTPKKATNSVSVQLPTMSINDSTPNKTDAINASTLAEKGKEMTMIESAKLSKFTPVLSKNMKVTKDITFNAPADEILQRFKEEMTKAGLMRNVKAHHDRAASLAKQVKPAVESTKEKFEPSLSVTARATSSFSDHQPNNSTKQIVAVSKPEDIASLFNPLLLKKVRENQSMKQKELEKYSETFDFTMFGSPSRQQRPDLVDQSSTSAIAKDTRHKSPNSKTQRQDVSFLQNYLVAQKFDSGAGAVETKNSSPRRGMFGPTSEAGRAQTNAPAVAGNIARRMSSSPLSRYTSISDQDEGFPIPVSRGTRDSFIWTAGAAPSTNKSAISPSKRVGSLFDSPYANYQSDTHRKSSSHLSHRKARLFVNHADNSEAADLHTPASTKTQTQPQPTSSSFKEQMTELGYLRKKAPPRYLIPEQQGVTGKVSINSTSPVASSPYNPNTAGAGLVSSAAHTISSRNSLEKLKRELVYLQSKQ
jgi:hypothetical protein